MTDIKISITTRSSVITPPQTQLWFHKEDVEVFGKLRFCATNPDDNNQGCPAVFTLKEPNLKTALTQQWQHFIRAINYNMTPQKIVVVLGHTTAFTNGTGFGDAGDPRTNYFTNSNLGSAVLPQFDKDRTCSRSVMTGDVVGDMLRVRTFNGNLPPPLKPGGTYPRTLAEVKLEDYLYTPRTHRWMFFAANNVSERNTVFPFSQGATYDWTGDDELYTWLPHVSRETILYPLNRLEKLPLGSPIPSPYRR